MAITLSQILDFSSAALNRYDIRGSTFMGIVELAGDAAYPAGGYPITAALVGLNQIQFVVPMCSNIGAAVVWDQVNQKVKLVKTAAALGGVFQEVAAGDVTTATRIYLLVSGI